MEDSCNPRLTKDPMKGSFQVSFDARHSEGFV